VCVCVCVWVIYIYIHVCIPLDCLVLLLKSHQANEEAYRGGVRILYNQARNTLTMEIRVARGGYTEKLENRFCVSVERRAAHHQPQESILLH